MSRLFSRPATFVAAVVTLSLFLVDSPASGQSCDRQKNIAVCGEPGTGTAEEKKQQSLTNAAVGFNYACAEYCSPPCAVESSSKLSSQATFQNDHQKPAKYKTDGTGAVIKSGDWRAISAAEPNPKDQGQGTWCIEGFCKCRKAQPASVADIYEEALTEIESDTLILLSNEL